MNLDEYKNIGTHWVALFYVKKDEVNYFDSFGIEYVPKEILKFIGNTDIKTNVFRVQAYNSILCGLFCVLFIDYMLAGKKIIHKSSCCVKCQFNIWIKTILFFS